MPDRLQSGDLVTIFGGAGFIGRHTVRLLARRGIRVRAASRRPDLAGHLQPMGAPGQIHAVQANLRYPDSIARAVEGADAVVNLVAVAAECGRQRFPALHVEGARLVARAAKEAGARSLVHVSAIGADPNGKANYSRSKGLGEQAVVAELPGAVILRPSLVFGPEDQLFNRFAGLATVPFPVLPVIAGKTRFQPVYVGDVAAAIVAALDGRARPGTVYELGGPEIVTMREIMRRTLQYSGRRRVLMPLAGDIAKLLALISKPLPMALRPVTVDQVRMLEVDNLVSDAARKESRTLEGLGITAPAAIAAIVPAYLERFQPRGQFAHYRG